MPITAMLAGGPPAGVFARMTTSSAACSTATHTEVSARQTSVTSSMPSRSADASRANSWRRSVLAAAIARSGSVCRPADATSARARPVRLDLEQLGARRAVGVLPDHLGCPHQQFGDERRRAEHVHQPLGHRALVAQRGEKPALLGHLVADPAVGQQPGIRVGGVGQPVQQRRQQHLLHPAAPPLLLGQRGQMGQRALRSLVTQCGELTFGRLGRHARRRTRRRGPRRTPAAVGRRAWRAGATPAGSGA